MTYRSTHRRSPIARAAWALATTLALSAGFASSAHAAPVGLGTADAFAVLAGSAVTNTGASVVTGDLGVSPGSAISGFPPGRVEAGTIHAADAVATQAQKDVTTAYNDAAGRSSTGAVPADLAGSTLTPGVYSSSSSMGLSGDLTLDAQGDPSATFIFQAGSTLTVGSGARVLLIGGAQACNVFWQVGSSATLGTGSRFVGTILALTSITLTTNATLDGRALARNGAVTLDTNNVTRSTCSTPTGGGTTGGGTTGSGTGGGTPGSGTTGGAPGSGTTGGGAPGTLTPIRGPRRCVDTSFSARVRGSRIAQVTFFVDGKWRQTIRARTGQTRFDLRVNPARQSMAAHRVTARVRFATASGTRARTLRFIYRRCATASQTPRFTG